MKTKICKKCGKEYPATPEYFYRRKIGKGGLNAPCKVCCKKYRHSPGQKLRESNYAKHKKSWKNKNTRKRCREWYLKNNYALTQKEFLFIYVNQNGCCAVCKKPVALDKIRIDHNHETGKVRGLLCNECNLDLGTIEKRLGNIGQVLEYLKTATARR